MHAVLNIASIPSQPHQNTPSPSLILPLHPYFPALSSSPPHYPPFPRPYQQIYKNKTDPNSSKPAPSANYLYILCESHWQSYSVSIIFPIQVQTSITGRVCGALFRSATTFLINKRNTLTVRLYKNYHRNLDRYFEFSFWSQDWVRDSFACFRRDSQRYLRTLEVLALNQSSDTLALSQSSWALVFSYRFSSTMIILCVGADDSVNSCFNCFISSSFCVIFLAQFAAASSIFTLSPSISFLMPTTTDLSTFGIYIQLYCLTTPILLFLSSFLTLLILFCSRSISTWRFRLLAFITQLQHSLPCRIPDEIKLYLAQISLKLPVCWSTLFLNSSTRV